jgi:HAMP domain-containing protein
MQLGFVKRVRESFSAKIIMLVASSVILTSFVVGLTTTRSTGKFLTDRMKDRFPSTLTTTTSRLRLWSDHQRGDAAEISNFPALGLALSRLQGARTEKDRIQVAAELAGQLHTTLSVYPNSKTFSCSTPTERLSRRRGASSPKEPTTRGSSSASWASMQASLRPFSTPMDFTSGCSLRRRMHPGPVAALMARCARQPFRVGRCPGEVRLGSGGDLFILDGQGKFVTQPRLSNDRLVGSVAMQVPTRQEGPITVERRPSYRNRSVFHSKVHLDELGAWLVYEEDYELAMAPVLEAQRRIWVSVLVVGAIFILLTLRIAQSILRPIKGLAIGARRINEGLVGVKIPRGSSDEIGLLIETFNEMAMKITLSQAELQYTNKKLTTINTELTASTAQLEKLSVTDGLTGLFNHRHFWNLMNTEMSNVAKKNGNLALVSSISTTSSG